MVTADQAVETAFLSWAAYDNSTCSGSFGLSLRYTEPIPKFRILCAETRSRFE